MWASSQQEQVRLQGILSVFSLLYKRLYTNLASLRRGSARTDIAKAVNVAEAGLHFLQPCTTSVCLITLLPQFRRYQNALLYELERLIRQLDSRELTHAFRVLKKKCNTYLNQTRKILAQLDQQQPNGTQSEQMLYQYIQNT